jgi:trans-aconitate 2-methyltransferase
MPAAWSAAQYMKFEDERTRPVADLLARVPLAAPQRVVDLGCGPGNSTAELVARFPGAEVIGLDSSPDMLAAARRRLPHIAFVEADIVSWQPSRPVSLLFANAVFQWVPDHITVLCRLMAGLAPGGALAVQMPDNLAEPSHLAMAETAADGPWAAKIAAAGIGREPLPPAEAYYDALAPLAVAVDVWRTTYHHPLADAAAIVEWVKGTGLHPYLAPLDADERAGFLAAYAGRLAEAYPARSDGRALLRYPRLFIVAVRA